VTGSHPPKDEPAKTELTTEMLLKKGLAAFVELRTGSVSNSTSDALVRIVAALPPVCHELRTESVSGRPGGLQRWAAATPPADGVFDHAAISINTCTDAMIAVYAEVIEAGMINSSTIFTLCRQGIESALLARWLLSDTDPQRLIARGFLARWHDLQEETDFFTNMSSAGAVEPSHVDPYRQKLARRHSELIALGREHRLVRRDGQRWLPTEKFPSGRALFGKVRGPEPHTDMRWLFNLLSGVAHGKAWASLSTTRHEVVKEYLNVSELGVRAPSGVVLARSNPSAETMVLPLQVMLLQATDVLGKVRLVRAAPAPASFRELNGR
jgi:hypothetical protein